MADRLLFLAHSGDGEIASCRLDADGRLHALTRTAVAPGCTALALDAARGRLFTATRGDDPGVYAFDVDAEGRLTQTAFTPLSPTLNYLTLADDGATLLAVSYRDGVGLSLPVGDDGALGEPVSRVEFFHPHSIITSPDGRHAYLAALGDDIVAQFALVAGALVPLDPPTVSAPAGSGPRHLVSNAAGDDLFCMTEFSGELIRYHRDVESGRLTREEAVPAHATDRHLGHSELDADPLEHHYVWGADVHLSPDERFVFASERTESTLVGVALGPGGTLGETVSITDTERQPRAFAVTAEGFLVAVGEKSERPAVYAIGADGALEPVEQPDAAASGGAVTNWVLVDPR